VGHILIVEVLSWRGTKALVVEGTELLGANM
jgi:hypothetical protein